MTRRHLAWTAVAFLCVFGSTTAFSQQTDGARAEYERALHEYDQSQRRHSFVLFDAVRTAVGLSDADAMLDHLRNALNLDKQFAPALQMYAGLALQSYRSERIDDALRRIDTSQLEDLPAVQALAIRLELARDSLTRAAQRWERLPSQLRNAPIVQYANAELLFRGDKPDDGLVAFEQSVTSPDTAVASAVRRDIAVMFADTDSLPRGGAILDYWKYRSALAGESVADRLALHFMRLHEARRNYWRKSTTSFPGLNSVIRGELSASREFDPRGIVFVRRGPPLDKFVEIVPRNKECWIYERAIEDEPLPPLPGCPPSGQAFMFVLSKSAPDWVLVDGFSCDPEGFDAQYSDAALRALRDCNMGNPTDFTAKSLAMRSRVNALAGLKRETVPRATKRVPFYFALQTVRELRGTEPVGVLVVAVPASSIRGEPHAGGVMYNFRVVVSMADSASRRVQQTNTTIIARSSAPLASDAFVRAIIEVPAVSGKYVDYRVKITDLNESDAAQTYQGARPITAFPPGEFGMSDILFARATSKVGGWRRGDVSLDLIPVQRFSGRFGVFFELYNVVASATYKVDIAVGEKSGGIFRRKRSIGLTYTEEMPSADVDRVPIYKEMRLDLGPGKYVMRVTVTDPNRKSIVRDRELVITD